MDAAFIFGNLGNVTSTTGPGWSTEDAFAWAIGTESSLTLPLPGDGRSYTLVFDIHPAVSRAPADRQRLTIMAGDTTLCTYTLTGRTSVTADLPLELTRGRTKLTLRLLHPDARRPSDHLPVDDTWMLALCFHSGSVTRSSGGGGDAGAEAVTGVIAGSRVARRIAEAIGKLRSVKGLLDVRFVDVARADAVPRGASFCWLDTAAGSPGERDRVVGRLPQGCAVATFRTPSVQALWPFLGPDPRAVPEAGRHWPARYPFGDRIAAGLAGMNMPDDVVYLMYEMAAGQEALDLDALLQADIQRWRQEDGRTDMKLAGFLGRNIRSRRLFASPALPAPDLLREMIEQILLLPPIEALVSPDDWTGELDALLDGYCGWSEELPVHKRVAEHFGLAWWSAELRYRWANNLRTYREHTLDYVRWAPWRE